MASEISSLPNELLDRIFSFLAEEKETIGACRLVCSPFKQLSSPYLITRVVYARRLDTISRLTEIMDHEYFYKHVTELVFDASSYDRYVATDWESYVTECANAPQLLRDPEWEDRKAADRAIWEKMRNSTKKGHLSPTIESPPADLIAREAFNGPWGWHEAEFVVVKSPDPPVEHHISCNDDNNEQENDNDDSTAGSQSPEPGEHQIVARCYHDRTYSWGCHRSFPDYHRRYIAQKQIDRRGKTGYILRRALSRLQALRSIVFTDWRELARPDESYNDCAHRLFGNTLPPDFAKGVTVYPAMCFKRLISVIEEDEEAQIESFSTGSHVFEHGFYDSDDPRHAIHIIPEAVESMLTIIGRLRRLDLSLYVSTGQPEDGEEDSENGIRSALTEASSLRHLTLAVRSRRMTPSQANVFPVGAHTFRKLLSGQHFPRLRVLDLRGWVLLEIEAFPQRHASTLRTVHLINCYDAENPVSLASWAGQNLKLDGVEIAWIPGAHDDFSRPDLSQIVRERAVRLSLKPEHEPLWLAGRKNFIVRKTRPRYLPDDGEQGWWMKTGREETEQSANFNA